ncbi:MAG TPA: hypothetical protein VGU20_32500 [Stellaceae bacterium]|nr:hypothetical protein [Stellaceae bacterium]
MTARGNDPQPHLPFAVILRLSDVALAKTELEATLGATVYRYERERAGPLHQAHIDVLVDDGAAHAKADLWAEIVAGVTRIGPAIGKLKQKHAVGRASLDLAVSFPEALALVSYALPSHVAKIVGQHGIDIEFSV